MNSNVYDIVLAWELNGIAYVRILGYHRKMLNFYGAWYMIKDTLAPLMYRFRIFFIHILFQSDAVL